MTEISHEALTKSFQLQLDGVLSEQPETATALSLFGEDMRIDVLQSTVLARLALSRLIDSFEQLKLFETAKTPE